MKQSLKEAGLGLIIALTIIVIAVAASVDIPFVYQGF